MANSRFFKLPGLELAIALVPVDPITGALRLTRTPADIMCGFIPGLSGVVLNAFRAALPLGVAGVLEDIPHQLLVSPAGAAMTIRSTSAADVGQIVRVGALGANYAAVAPFDVALNGTTLVPLLGSTPLTRFNFLGRRSGDFVGNILVESGGVTYAAIQAGQNVMRSSQYTVPAGFRFFLSDVSSSLVKLSGATAVVPFALQLKPVASTGFGDLTSWSLQENGTSSLHFGIQYAQGLTGPVDLRTVGTASALNIDAQTLVSGILQDLSVTNIIP